MSDEYEYEKIEMPIGYISDRVSDWNAFCADTGLNPWCMNEGLVSNNTKIPFEIMLLKKHGLLI
jgi:LPS sulfotransferase NodH